MLLVDRTDPDLEDLVEGLVTLVFDRVLRLVPTALLERVFELPTRVLLVFLDVADRVNRLVE